jgi:hypothetical protein
MDKDKKTDDQIKEGTGDNAINRDPKEEEKRKSYPKLNEKDQQLKDQPEFIDKEPNKKPLNDE